MRCLAQERYQAVRINDLRQPPFDDVSPLLVPAFGSIAAIARDTLATMCSSVLERQISSVKYRVKASVKTNSRMVDFWFGVSAHSKDVSP